jgi:hypothetical protein
VLQVLELQEDPTSASLQKPLRLPERCSQDVWGNAPLCFVYCTLKVQGRAHSRWETRQLDRQTRCPYDCRGMLRPAGAALGEKALPQVPQTDSQIIRSAGVLSSQVCGLTAHECLV